MHFVGREPNSTILFQYPVCFPFQVICVFGKNDVYPSGALIILNDSPYRCIDDVHFMDKCFLVSAMFEGIQFLVEFFYFAL